MLQIVCQWLLVVWIVAAFFSSVLCDFYGRDKKDPGGFAGFIGTLIAIFIMVFVLYNAGGFSNLFGR